MGLFSRGTDFSLVVDELMTKNNFGQIVAKSLCAGWLLVSLFMVGCDRRKSTDGTGNVSGSSDTRTSGVTSSLAGENTTTPGGVGSTSATSTSEVTASNAASGATTPSLSTLSDTGADSESKLVDCLIGELKFSPTPKEHLVEVMKLAGAFKVCASSNSASMRKSLSNVIYPGSGRLSLAKFVVK